MRINTNVASLQAQNANSLNNSNLSSSLEKLSTGSAINGAADNASGLAIADKLRTQASSLGQAVSNGNAAITLTQIADKAMAEQSNILDTIKTKLVQASTATTTSAGLTAISEDIKKLSEQLVNIAKNTNYNGMTLLRGASDGTAAVERSFQMGEFSGDTISLGGGTSAADSIDFIQSDLVGLGLSTVTGDVSSVTSMAVTTHSDASALLASVDTALDKLNVMRGAVGSTQNQLESKTRNISETVTNVKAAESVIRDVDYAAESANFNKLNIIAQAGTYAISQANSAQQNVMTLLR